MRAIVCGSRSWVDEERLFGELDALKQEAHLMHSSTAHWHPSMLVVVHGDCDLGADALAAQWAAANNVQVEAFPADWERFGKAAGPIRNREMAAKGADRCVAFWDSRSHGTLDMLAQCVRHGIPVRIVPEVRRK